MKYLRFNGNVMDYSQKDSVQLVNVGMIEMMDNYFGFPVALPSVLITYQSIGSTTCREPVDYSNITKVKQKM